MSTQPLSPPPERTPAVLSENSQFGSGFSWPWVQWFQQIQVKINAGLSAITSLSAKTTPGPFANDAAAAISGVAIGGQYYKSTGEVFVRLT